MSVSCPGYPHEEERKARALACPPAASPRSPTAPHFDRRRGAGACIAIARLIAAMIGAATSASRWISVFHRHLAGGFLQHSPDVGRHDNANKTDTTLLD